MALPTAVNSQITDAVTQANVKTLGDSPALSLSNLYQIVSQSLGLAAQNAVMGQQQSNVIHQAATTQGVSLLYSVDTASDGVTTSQIYGSNTPESLANILGVVKALQGPRITG